MAKSTSTPAGDLGQARSLEAPHRKVRVSVAGASGYAGGELLRLLAAHPCVELVHLAAGAQSGKKLEEVFPSLGHDASRSLGLATSTLTEPDYDQFAAHSDAVFLCLPHGLSIEAVPQLLSGGVKVVDLGGDFRLRSKALFEQWYQTDHSAPELLTQSVYGLPELFREDLRKAQLVANPGCYPTAAALALLPLAKAGLLDSASIIVDAKSGVSGAGRKASVGFGYSEVNENTKAYGVLKHRHQPEMEQTLRLAAQLGLAASGGESPDSGPSEQFRSESRSKSRSESRLKSGSNVGPGPSVNFVPHLVPMTRGILATCYVTLPSEGRDGARALDSALIDELYQDCYRDEPFVRFLRDGALPATKNVAGSNFSEVAVYFDAERSLLVAIAAIDNLGKGAASAAVVNFNLQWGLPETTGLCGLPLFP